MGTTEEGVRRWRVCGDSKQLFNCGLFGVCRLKESLVLEEDDNG